jgi:chromosomal replication initiation ATPase DnaA
MTWVNYQASSVREIISKFEQYYEIPKGSIVGASRSKVTKIARHGAMWEARMNTGLSYPELGLLFNRHHSSIVVAVNKRGIKPNGRII